MKGSGEMKGKSGVPYKGMNPVLANMSMVQRDALLMRSANKAHLLLTLMVLHDKYGFGEKRLNRFMDEYKKQLDAYNEGYVESVKDFEAVLWEECGIKVDL